MTLLARLPAALLNGFSQIFLQAHAACGLLIVLAIAVQSPALLAGALVGALAGTLGAAALGRARTDIDSGLYGYNATLLGLLIVLMLGPSALALGLVATGALLIDPLQARLLAGLRERRWLPGFTLPFVLFGWLTLALLDAALLDAFASAPAAQPAGLAVLDAQGLARAVAAGIGQVIFLDRPLAGLLVPLLAIVAAVLLGRLFDELGLPPLTMPFILACWLVALAGRRCPQPQRS